MCRFLIYLGKEPALMNDVIGKPKNSLIAQSLHAQKIEQPVNADGFGIGWYQKDITPTPARFKSIQPAWNDKNLYAIANITLSTCFMGHVRRSTHGDVNRGNCHPFSHKNNLFCHNGGIDDFMSIQRHLRRLLTDELYHKIKGQTDSEHFFALMMNHFQTLDSDNFLDKALQSFESAAGIVKRLQREHANTELSELNTVLTDGSQVVATRYRSSDHQKALSLYYTQGTHIKAKGSHPILEYNKEQPNALIIASEPLSDYSGEWREVPPNHAILVDQDLNAECRAINA